MSNGSSTGFQQFLCSGVTYSAFRKFSDSFVKFLLDFFFPNLHSGPVTAK